MFIVQSYGLAILMCIVTMLCWGSWANTAKMAPASWRFPLFYWDYVIGVLLISLLLALTMGSFGAEGRGFIADFQQAENANLWSAFLGGVIFNLSNILLVAAIDIAGIAVAFPLVVGIALVLGIIINYLAVPVGHPVILFAGVLGISLAIVLTAMAYGRLQQSGEQTMRTKGIMISLVAGILMGFFYRFVAASMADDFANPEIGKLTPYTAMFIFAVGMFLSNFLWNGAIMKKPFVGEPIPFKEYFKQTRFKVHAIGLLGGFIWGIGTLFNYVASGAAGYAISYGLGQGAAMVAAFWGVFIWKEFKNAPTGTNKLIMLMFVLYIIGLVLIILARNF